MFDRHGQELTSSRYVVNREIELGANGATLDKSRMTLGERIEAGRVAIGISQAELARRVGIRQSTMNSLINGDSRSSRSIVAIARELGTTPAYLTGEIDDPDKDSPPPRAEPRVQFVTLQVALPSEAALADMFEAQLRVYGDLSGAELARALAKRLPSGLARLREAPLIEPSVEDHAPPAEDELPSEDRPAIRQARRK